MQHLPVRHTLDVMHIEKNVAATTMGFLLGKLDTIAVRKDAQEASVMGDIYMVRQGDSDNYLKPQAPYVLLPNDKKRVLETILRMSKHLHEIAVISKNLSTWIRRNYSL